MATTTQRREAREQRVTARYYSELRASKVKTRNLLSKIFGERSMVNVNDFQQALTEAMYQKFNTCFGCNEVLEIADREHGLIEFWKEAAPHMVVRRFKVAANR